MDKGSQTASRDDQPVMVAGDSLILHWDQRAKWDWSTDEGAWLYKAGGGQLKLEKVVVTHTVAESGNEVEKTDTIVAPDGEWHIRVRFDGVADWLHLKTNTMHDKLTIEAPSDFFNNPRWRKITEHLYIHPGDRSGKVEEIEVNGTKFEASQKGHCAVVLHYCHGSGPNGCP